RYNTTQNIYPPLKKESLRMKKIAFTSIMAMIITGCASTPKVHYTDVSIPNLNEKREVFLGDTLLKQGRGYYGDSITITSASGVYSSIDGGVYCKRNNNSNNYYSTNNQAIALKNTYGNITGYSNFVSYDKSAGKICPSGISLGCYDSTEISVSYKPHAFCAAENSFQQIIEYNGKSGKILNFTYREFSNNLARSAFTTNFKMDLREGDTVAYKGAMIKVFKATNNKITYELVRNFNTY
ncbi:hypothetical protein M3P05_20570, partial [Sansalvadorimonas sp. 2012CJ34-2]